MGQKERGIKKDCLGYQQKRVTSRIEWPRRKERPRGLPRGPGEKRDQEDGGDQKKRGTKRIAKDTAEKWDKEDRED